MFSSENHRTFNWSPIEEEVNALLALKQPLTASQLARKLDRERDRCSYLLRRFASLGLVTCITSLMRRNRLFWPTEIGRDYQEELALRYRRRVMEYDFPIINWRLYAQVCFSQRAAVVKHLMHPMQPAQIRRVAVSRNPDLKLSANNVRDVIRFLRSSGLVAVVVKTLSDHPLYDLTQQGKRMQRLLRQAEQTE